MTEHTPPTQAPVKVLVIGGGSAAQPKLRANIRGVTTAVLCRASVLGWVHELEDNELVVVLKDSSSVEAWLVAGRAIYRDWKFDRIASLAEIDQDKAALIAADLGLAFHTPQTVANTHDKLAMRRALEHAGVETIPFRQVESASELADFFQEVGPPLIVKPSKGRASAGISVVTTSDEISSAYEETVSASAPRLEKSLPIAERLVQGPEFSIETVSHEGEHFVLGITEKFKDDRTKVELGHVIPARISNSESELLASHVRNCLTALGIRNGVTHSEAILSEDGPVLVETHLRQGGDEIPELLTSATGLDLVDLMVSQVAGEDISLRQEISSRRNAPHYVHAAAIRYLASDVVGDLQSVDNLDQVRDEEGVDNAIQLLEDGTKLKGLLSSYSRVASVRVNAADSNAAVTLAEEMISRIELHVSIHG